MAVGLTKSRARALTKKILALANAELEVRITEQREGNTRFAQNQVTTSGDVSAISVRVTAHVAGRRATATTSATDDASLASVVAEAEETAALSPVDPEQMPLLGPQRYLSVAARDRATAKFGAQGRADLVRDALTVGRARGLETAGFVIHSEQATAFANSGGLFGHVSRTSITTSVTCRTKDGTGSGRASQVSHRVDRIDAKSLAAIAADKADMSSSPEAFDVGKQRVVLEPQAVGDLLGFLLSALSERAADEGRSAFSRKGGSVIGESLFDSRISLRSDPAHPDHPASPVSASGLPQAPITWIEAGVLKNLTRSRFWAQKTGRDPVPGPSSLHMAGTDKSTLDLVKGVDRAVLVTRFWYNRMLDPRTILVTGLTRDGTFLVEQGKITKAVKNYRYNDSPLTLLQQVEALGKPERVTTRSGLVMVVPAMVVSGFNFASISDAV